MSGDEIRPGRHIWTVEVADPDDDRAAWTVWSDWVDRATAEIEADAARLEGYEVRIRLAS